MVKLGMNITKTAFMALMLTFMVGCEQVKIDACLDSGGRWDKSAHVCEL